MEEENLAKIKEELEIRLKLSKEIVKAAYPFRSEDEDLVRSVFNEFSHMEEECKARTHDKWIREYEESQRKVDEERESKAIVAFVTKLEPEFSELWGQLSISKKRYKALRSGFVHGGRYG